MRSPDSRSMSRLGLALSTVGILVALTGCGDSEEMASDDSALTDTPSESGVGFLDGSRWQSWLKENFPDAYAASPREVAEKRGWYAGFSPATDPVYAHNAIEIPSVRPRDVLAKLRAGRADLYTPISSKTYDCATRAAVSLELGKTFCWETLGRELKSVVVELDDSPEEAALAWRDVDNKYLHRWILRATTTGTRVITEECQRGAFAWTFAGQINPTLHASHEAWLVALAGSFKNAAGTSP